MAQKTELDASPAAAVENSAAPETNSAEPPSPNRASGYLRERPNTRFFLIGAVLVLLVGGFFAWRYFSSYESTDDAQVDGHVMPVSARISGYVSKVNVGDNQYVQSGATLVEVDPRDYQVAVDQARANVGDAQATAQSLNIDVPVTSVNTSSQVSSSEADVSNTQAGIAAAQQQFDAAQAQLLQAQANDVKAQNDLVRYKQLVDKQEISQQQYDQAVAAAAASAAGVAAARPPDAGPGKLAVLPNWTQPGCVHAGSREFRGRRCESEASCAGTSRAESPVHKNHRARHRRGHQKCRSGHERSTRPAVGHRRSAG